MPKMPPPRQKICLIKVTQTMLIQLGQATQTNDLTKDKVREISQLGIRYPPEPNKF